MYIEECTHRFSCQKSGYNCKSICKDLIRIRADVEIAAIPIWPKAKSLFWLTMQAVSLDINFTQHATSHKVSSPVLSASGQSLPSLTVKPGYQHTHILLCQRFGKQMKKWKKKSFPPCFEVTSRSCHNFSKPNFYKPNFSKEWGGKSFNFSV